MDKGCICEGNWREIVAESRPLFSTWFKDTEGRHWLFQGILWADDDFYYTGVDHSGRLRRMSCVMNLQGWGMTPLLQCALCSRWQDPEKIIEHLGDCNVEMET